METSLQSTRFLSWLSMSTITTTESLVNPWHELPLALAAVVGDRAAMEALAKT